jgi:DNA-binding transcriptional LysR family regulator
MNVFRVALMRNTALLVRVSDDRQAGILNRAGSRTAFWACGQELRRGATDILAERPAARRHAGRTVGQAFFPFLGIHARRRARAGVGTTHGRRRAGHAAGNSADAQGLGPNVRIAAMPSAMPIIASLTAPFQIRHPTVRFTLITRTADEVIKLLHEREIDAGVRYVNGESLDDVQELPLYREEYLLLTTLDGPFGGCDRVAWKQLAELPLCLFTPNLQHRRIVDNALREAGVCASPTIETDSVLALTTHVLTGNWVSVVSSLIVNAIDLSGPLRVVPISKPTITHMIGLVVSRRFSVLPTVVRLLEEAREGALTAKRRR